jgi:hypothetical protein
MRRINLGVFRTGQIIATDIPYVRGKERFVKNVRGEDTAEITIPIEALQGDLRDFKKSFKPKTRFIQVHDDDFENPVTFAGYITKVREEDNKTITVLVSSMKTALKVVPAVPFDKRGRISSDLDTWNLKGSPEGIMREILEAVTNDSDGFPTIKSIALPGNPAGDYEKVIRLYELPSVSEVMDTFLDDYEGVEMWFAARYKDSSHIEWFLNVGTIQYPHINKQLTPLEVDIDEDDGNLTFEAITDGTGSNNSNWAFYQSGKTSEVEGEEAWIDLTSKRKQPTDPEDWMSFQKDKATVPLNDAELNAQLDARLNISNIDIKTFNVTQFNDGHSYVQNLGRLLHFTGSTRMENLNETIRIVQISWSLTSEKVEIIVQPKEYRVYPKLPKDLSDIGKNEVDKGIKDGGWKTPVSGIDLNSPYDENTKEATYKVKMINARTIRFDCLDNRVYFVTWEGIYKYSAEGEKSTYLYTNRVFPKVDPAVPSRVTALDTGQWISGSNDTAQYITYSEDFPQKFKIKVNWAKGNDDFVTTEHELSYNDFLMPGGGNFPGGGGFPGTGGGGLPGGGLPPFNIKDPFEDAEPIFRKISTPIVLDRKVFGPSMTSWKNYVYGVNKPGWMLFRDVNNSGSWNNGEGYEPGEVEIRKITMNDDGTVNPTVETAATITPNVYNSLRLNSGTSGYREHAIHVSSFVINGKIVVYFMEYKQFGDVDEGYSDVQTWALENTLDDSGNVNGVWVSRASSFTPYTMLGDISATTKIFPLARNLVPYGANLDNIAVVGAYSYPAKYTYKRISGTLDYELAHKRSYTANVFTRNFSGTSTETPWVEDSEVPFTPGTDKEGKLLDTDKIAAVYKNGSIFSTNLTHVAEKTDVLYKSSAQSALLGSWSKQGTVRPSTENKDSPTQQNVVGLGAVGEYIFWDSGKYIFPKDGQTSNFPFITINYTKIGFEDIVRETLTTDEPNIYNYFSNYHRQEYTPDWMMDPAYKITDDTVYKDSDSGAPIFGMNAGYTSKFITWNENAFLFAGEADRPNQFDDRVVAISFKLI